MAQTKKNSFIEAFTNTMIGLIISLITTPLVFKICGIKYSGLQLGSVTLLMTFVSIARSYIIRRLFNKKEK